jgi:hypothetical protein
VTEPTPAPRATTSPWWYTSGAILAAVLAAGYALTLRTHIGFLDQAIREGRAQTQAAQGQLIDVQGQLQRAQAGASQAPLVAGILSARDMVPIDMAPHGSGAPAAGRAFWSASTGLLFTASALPRLPAAQAYQLWLEPAATQPRRSLGLLAPDAAGRATLAVPPFPGPPAGFAVTIEPAGGAASPGGPQVLTGSR